jgi:proline iminopeptidase
LERKEAFDDPAYARAAMAFYRRHICRLRTWPRELTRSLRDVSLPVYRTMWGPSEFAVQGSLRYWDVTDRLPTIRVPTLITGGKYDEITPRIARTLHRAIRGSELAIFPNSSHLPMWEERERYMQVVGRFLRRQADR